MADDAKTEDQDDQWREYRNDQAKLGGVERRSSRFRGERIAERLSLDQREQGAARRLSVGYLSQRGRSDRLLL